MHKKIMEKCSEDLMKDSKKYQKNEKVTKSKTKKKHDVLEKKEAISAAEDLKSRVKKAH